MAGLRIGYIDVRTGLFNTPKPTLYTFPLDVLVSLGAPQLDDGIPVGQFLGWIGQNPVDLNPPSGADLFVGAAVTRADDTGQALDIAIVPAATLLDAEVTVRVNTSIFTESVNYTTDPNLRRGESFVIVGCRSTLGGAVPTVAFRVGSTNGAAVVAPRDVTSISVKGNFDKAPDVFVGQRRQRTAKATYTRGGDYRRAVGSDGQGLLLDVRLHDPTRTDPSWVHVDVTQPRSTDGPAQAPAPVAHAGGAGPLPAGTTRTYQVAWVHGTWSGTTATAHVESDASPPSTPVTTTTGAIDVPLPAWQKPDTRSLGPAAPPEPMIGWRIYRTVSGSPDTGGDAYLVHEEPAPKTNPGDPVAAKTWTDTVPDASLATPRLSELKVDFRHTQDSKGTVLLDGFATMDGRLAQSSYYEDATGSPYYEGTTYGIRLSAGPGAAVVGYTTQPAGGRPRLEWASRSPAGPTGVAAAAVTADPTGAAIGRDQSFDVGIETAPAEFGVDWSQRGPDQTRVEIGTRADATLPLDLDHGVGLVTGRAARGDATRTAPSARAVDVDAVPHDLRFTVRALRRLRLLLGLPRPVTPVHAVAGDGIVVELAFDRARQGRGRSLRMRLDQASSPAAGTGSGVSRLVVRAGDVPDTVALDLRPGDPFPDGEAPATPLSGLVVGRLRRIAVLYQTAADLGLPVADGHRRDGVGVAIPDGGERLDFSLDHRQLTVTPAGPIRVATSLRSSPGLGGANAGSSAVHQVQADVSTAAPLTVRLPQADGSLGADAGGGFSGRVAVSGRGLDPTKPDRLLAVRATPQGSVALRRVAGEQVMDDLTVRALGVTEVNKPADLVGPHYRVGFTAGRVNKAARARVILTDDRIKPDTWEMARVRIGDLPESVRVTADTKHDRYSIDLNRRSGRVVVFAQPPLVPTDGIRAGSLVGIGLAEADIDSLPTGLQVDLLGPKNDLPAHPFNATPAADWRLSGFRIAPTGEVTIRALNLASVAYVRPRTYPTGAQGLPWSDDGFVPPTAFWTFTAASLLRIHSENADPPGAFWIWTPAAPLPHLPQSEYTQEGAWRDLPSWLGYKIESPALVDLQIQPYQEHTAAMPARWNDVAWAWLLKGEFQMKDYRGEVTVQDDLWPAGDTDGGPGHWTLRVPDGLPIFKGQIVFGNTGGWFSNRPRIYPPFTPTPTQPPPKV